MFFCLLHFFLTQRTKSHSRQGPYTALFSRYSPKDQSQWEKRKVCHKNHVSISRAVSICVSWCKCTYVSRPSSSKCYQISHWPRVYQSANSETHTPLYHCQAMSSTLDLTWYKIGYFSRKLTICNCYLEFNAFHYQKAKLIPILNHHSCSFPQYIWWNLSTRWMT